MAMEWKAFYATHIDEIDKQHQRLFELGNRIYTLAIKSDQEEVREEIKTIFSELRAYTKYHFEFEESLLRDYNYPDIEKHIKEHMGFVDQISSYEDQLEMGDIKQTVLGLIMFVSKWISNHIVVADLAYSKYIKDLKNDH